MSPRINFYDPNRNYSIVYMCEFVCFMMFLNIMTYICNAYGSTNIHIVFSRYYFIHENRPNINYL
jgi:hypothetical protein